jgi:hypothetical protein
MAIQTTSIFLGSTPIPLYYLGDKQASLNPETAFNYVVRNDAFGEYIKLAMPYSLFPSLGMNNYYDNIAALISGSGTSLPMVPTGSNVGSAPPILQTTSSMVSSGSYNFGANGYATSLYISGSQNAGTVTGSLLEFGSQNWVMECWFNYNEVASGTPPFNMFFFGVIDGNSLLLDAARIASIFRVVGSGAITANPNGPWNQTKNVWFHLAYVRSGTSIYVYLNGNKIGTGSASGAIATPTNGYWRILGNNSGNNNDGAGKLIQDYRLYIGTDKNYTGSIIPVPDSIVTTINL